ncbi:sensory neuron membrane protein 1-like [Copidosoma floridanum]|uniref:sensory neuron membrane protein 1-like n=1 Tax=Copidosoma floridanum TaxID=29053 RepID=UPI0006C96314|nr:sensory neuron membrane protein 1-like [Copidosoma floridanum]
MSAMRRVIRYSIDDSIIYRDDPAHCQTELRPGKFMRDIWSAYPFTFDNSFYVFNITNPEDIAGGAKPILQEIGPFVYDQYQEKSNQVDHDEDDTVSYTNKYTYHFNAEKSKGLTGEEEVVVPNYFILGLVNSLLIDKPSAVPIIGKGVDSIFKKPSSIFIRAKVKEVLFDGFVINCTVKDFAGAAICSEVRDQYEDLKMIKIAEDVYLMSLFGSSNGTSSKSTIRVNRGSKKLMKLGQVTEFKGVPNISTWNDPVCDLLNGTDGSIFRPFLKKNKPYGGIFVEPICRNLQLSWLGSSRYSGVKTFSYTSSLGVDPESNPHDKCFCHNPDECLKPGVFDAYKCAKLPIIISNPHFYLADPHYLTLVDGLKAEKDKHMLHVDLEPNSGVPIHANTRVQINMLLTKVEKFKLMKNMPEALLPLLWIENTLNLPNSLVRVIKMALMLLLLAKITYYLAMIGGIGFSVYSGILYYRAMKMRKSTEIQEVPQPIAENEKPDVVDKTLPLNFPRLQPAQLPPIIN